MIWKISTSGPELTDRLVQVTAIGLGMLAVISFLDATQLLVNEATAEVIDNVVAVIAVLMVIAIAPVLIMKIRQARQTGESVSDCAADESGFISETMRRAMGKSWMITMLSVTAALLFKDEIPMLEARF